MANTSRGYPYPVGTDRVADGDNAMQALAEKVDSQLGYGICSGDAIIPAPGTAGASASVSVTFPVGLFTQPPKVVGSVAAAVPSAFYGVTVSTITTAAGTTLYGSRLTGPASTIPVQYIAHGR